MELLDFFLSGVGLIIALAIALIPLIIAIGLIVTIFQINSRLAELLRLQRLETSYTLQSADIHRQAFIAQLSAGGPNHKEYLDYLVALDYLTQDQAAFVLKQSGNEKTEIKELGTED